MIRRKFFAWLFGFPVMTKLALPVPGIDERESCLITAGLKEEWQIIDVVVPPDAPREGDVRLAEYGEPVLVMFIQQFRDGKWVGVPSVKLPDPGQG